MGMDFRSLLVVSGGGEEISSVAGNPTPISPSVSRSTTRVLTKITRFPVRSIVTLNSVV